MPQSGCIGCFLTWLVIVVQLAYYVTIAKALLILYIAGRQYKWKIKACTRKDQRIQDYFKQKLTNNAEMYWVKWHEIPYPITFLLWANPPMVFTAIGYLWYLLGVGHDWQYNPFGLEFRILVSSHILPTVMFRLPSALGFSISLTFFPVVLALTTHGPSIIHPYVLIRSHDSTCTYPQADDSHGLLMWAQKFVC